MLHHARNRPLVCRSAIAVSVAVGLSGCTTTRDPSNIYIGKDNRMRYHDPQKNRFVLCVGENCPLYFDVNLMPASTDGARWAIVGQRALDDARRSPEARPARDDPEGHWSGASHGIQVGLRFQKTNFHAGEAMAARLIVRNVGTRSIEYIHWKGWDQDLALFVGNLQSDGPSPKRWTSFQNRLRFIHHGVYPRRLRPGEQEKFDFDLHSLFEFQPGTYRVFARKRLSGFNEKPFAELTSGTAIIAISP